MKLKGSLSGLELPKNRLYYYLIAGNLLVLVLIGIFVLRPVMGLLGRHAAEITRTKGEIAALERKTEELRDLRESLPSTRAVYRPVIKNAPKTKDVAGYQTELEDLADLTRLHLITVDMSGGTSGQSGASAPGAGSNAPGSTKQTVGAFPAFPVSIEVSGTYANILDFMNRLETMDRFTRITGVTFASEDTTGSVNSVITAQSLYLGETS